MNKYYELEKIKKEDFNIMYGERRYGVYYWQVFKSFTMFCEVFNYEVNKNSLLKYKETIKSSRYKINKKAALRIIEDIEKNIID